VPGPYALLEEMAKDLMRYCADRERTGNTAAIQDFLPLVMQWVWRRAVFDVVRFEILRVVLPAAFNDAKKEWE
tara:strand:+ start:2564 stop:2782 length:219 start_codon:yes stop_codon:yes gene_type:complete